MKKHIFTVSFMVGITFIFISMIAGVHMLTADVVARNRTLFQQQAVYTALNLPIPDDVAQFIEQYNQLVEEVAGPDGTIAYFRVTLPESQAGDGVALVIREYGPGLWGTITAMVGFEPDADRYRGVVFLEHNETPGLGARIDEPWFRKQFAGASGPFDRLVQEPQDKGRAGQTAGAIDQITGATTSSRAVLEIMNKSAIRAAEIAGR